MVNLKHHSDSSLKFLEDVIKSKRNSSKDPDYKSRLAVLEAGIKLHYQKYDPSFAADSLHTLASAGYSGKDKEDILTLYAYQSAIMQKLKEGVTTVELKRVINTCQNCTIGEINSFDHTVPQGEFPEFVVHPKNLFPSCSRCNSHKSSIWRNSGGRLFLNLYLDKLPNLQYLYVSINVKPGDIEASFSVLNPNGIDHSLFSKIAYHYQKLQLCERFSDNIDKVVTPLQHNISASLNSLTIEEAVKVAKDTADRNRKSYGFNYWKSILQLKLLDSAAFLNICIDNK
jgi:hypothetical protein